MAPLRGRRVATAALHSRLAQATDALIRDWRARAHRPLVGVIGVPLLMTAAGLAGLLGTWRLLLLASAVATSGWRWTWVLAFQLAVIGAEWASIGVEVLASTTAGRTCRLAAPGRGRSKVPLEAADRRGGVQPGCLDQGQVWLCRDVGAGRCGKTTG